MKIRFTSICAMFVLMVFISMTSGCSVHKALTQPDKKNLDVLERGTHQDILKSELGASLYPGEIGEEKYELFSFTQGYANSNKVARATLHIVADFFTLMIWEPFGYYVIEKTFEGKDMNCLVLYDKNGYVKDSNCGSLFIQADAPGSRENPYADYKEAADDIVNKITDSVKRHMPDASVNIHLGQSFETPSFVTKAFGDAAMEYGLGRVVPGRHAPWAFITGPKYEPFIFRKELRQKITAKDLLLSVDMKRIGTNTIISAGLWDLLPPDAEDKNKMRVGEGLSYCLSSGYVRFDWAK